MFATVVAVCGLTDAGGVGIFEKDETMDRGRECEEYTIIYDIIYPGGASPSETKK